MGLVKTSFGIIHRLGQGPTTRPLLKCRRELEALALLLWAVVLQSCCVLSGAQSMNRRTESGGEWIPPLARPALKPATHALTAGVTGR